MVADRFYAAHRGGHGAVVLTQAMGRNGDILYGIFGSIEMARQWADRLGDDYACLHAPFLVDDPDWGNRQLQ